MGTGMGEVAGVGVPACDITDRLAEDGGQRAVGFGDQQG